MFKSVTSKFTGLFRGFRRQEAVVPPAPEWTDAPIPGPTFEPPTQPVQPFNRPVAARAATAAPFSRPAPGSGNTTSFARRAQPFAAAQPAAAPAGNPHEVALPIAAIISALPTDLRARVVCIPPPGTALNLPLEIVTSQLASGTVKISFGDLRRLAASIFANSGDDQDNRFVILPLNEILSRVNPALLTPQSKKRVEVAEDITGPFDGRGTGISFTTQPIKTASATRLSPSSTPVAEPAPAHKIPAPSFAPAVAPAPAPAPAPVAPVAAAPVAPAPAPEPVKPIAFAPPPDFNRPPTAPPASANKQYATPPIGQRPAAAPLPSVSLPKVDAAAAAPKPAVSPVPAAPAFRPPQPMIGGRPVSMPPVIFAVLDDLAEKWPEELKSEIFRLGVAKSNVLLAGAMVDAGLRKGRVTTTWKQLRTLVKPSSAESPHDALELELPLKVIAPLFLAAQKNQQKSQKKTAVSDEIPDLFYGAETPMPVTPVAPVAPAAEAPVAPAPARAEAPEPVAAREPVPAIALDPPPTAEPELEEELAEAAFVPPPVMLADFGAERPVSPKEVVAQARAMSGVAGVAITLPDGLRLASDVPPDFNADTLAAFIPQLFERMNQTTKELKMGALNNISFTTDNVPWCIFRMNKMYFAAFGAAGQVLPAARLAVLAKELNQKAG